MEIKEMDYCTKTRREMYIETSFCKSVKQVILSEIKKYNQDDIDKVKIQILDEIKGLQCQKYLVKELSKNKYDIHIADKKTSSIDSEILKEIIRDIKERYIYEEALMQLSHEYKLIPTVYQRLHPIYSNNADISVNIKYNGGSEYIYIYLDLFGIMEFKVSATI